MIQSKNKLGVLIGILATILLCLSAYKVLSNANEKQANDFDISKFDTTKEAINVANGMAYEPVIDDNSASNIGHSIELNKNKRSATIIIDWSKYGKLWSEYGNASIWEDETVKYEVTNFTKNIKEVYIAGFTSSSGFETAFYIMEDGTVEYTPIVSALKNNNSSSDKNLKSYGKIENVSDVVKLISATGYYPNDEQAVTGGTYILGIKADGNFYNLSEIINTNNNY